LGESQRSVSGFGAIRSAFPERMIQFVLKFVFQALTARQAAFRKPAAYSHRSATSGSTRDARRAGM